MSSTDGIGSGPERAVAHALTQLRADAERLAGQLEQARRDVEDSRALAVEVGARPALIARATVGAR